MGAPANLLSVDAEDYYSLAVRDQLGMDVEISPDVVPQTRQLLAFFEQARLRATWFIVGSLARAQPHLVADVAAAGHEVASHGYAHVPLSHLTPGTFRSDLALSVRVLEDAAGSPVRAFRAPAFSLRAEHTWAFDIMADLGIATDSSLRIIWPWGLSSGRAVIEAARQRGVREIPGFAVGAGRWGIPVGGGGGLRVLPAGITRAILRRVNRAGLPAALYVHPYDLPAAGARTAWPPSRWPAAFRLWRFDALQNVGRRRLARRLLDAAAAGDLATPAVSVRVGTER